MAFTSADLAAIDAAIASGELSVQFADRRVQYRSIQELKDARSLITGQLSSTSETRPSRQFRVNVSKGVY
jgi:hypothetical protein